MIKLSAPALAFALVLAAGARPARADSASSVAGSLGVGMEYQLSGLGGMSANYDAGPFHVGGFFGFDDPTGANNTAFDVGARFYYHIHRTATADFSIGGSLGIGSLETPAGGMGGANTATSVFLDPGFQIRWFASSNVALSFTGGFSIGLDDDKTFRIDGQLSGVAGIHYYFTK